MKMWKETFWGQSELPDQMTVLVQSRSLAFVFYFHRKGSEKELSESSLQIWQFASDQTQFYWIWGLTKNSSHSTAFLAEGSTFTPAWNSTVWRGKLIFFKTSRLTFKSITGCRKTLWCASSGEAKRQEESFFIFLFLENVADPVICTQEPFSAPSKLLV